MLGHFFLAIEDSLTANQRAGLHLGFINAWKHFAMEGYPS